MALASYHATSWQPATCQVEQQLSNGSCCVSNACAKPAGCALQPCTHQPDDGRLSETGRSCVTVLCRSTQSRFELLLFAVIAVVVTFH
jgi:hypothetical protein